MYELTMSGLLEMASHSKLVITDENEAAEFIQEITSLIDGADDSETFLQDLAVLCFNAGALWNGMKIADNDQDFTVVVETVPFLASLMKKGSINIRFAFENTLED